MQAVYRGVVRPIHLALISWTGKVRFSIAEVVILLTGISVLIWFVSSIIRLIKHPEKGKQCLKIVLTLISIVLCIYAGFCVLWGVYYYSEDFSENTGIRSRDISVEELETVTAYFAAKANEYADLVKRDENGLYTGDKAEIIEKSGTLDERIIKDFNANREYWEKYETPVQNVSNAVYEEFLCSYDQDLGLKSYGACVDLLVSYYLEDAENCLQGHALPSDEVIRRELFDAVLAFYPATAGSSLGCARALVAMLSFAEKYDVVELKEAYHQLSEEEKKLYAENIMSVSSMLDELKKDQTIVIGLILKLRPVHSRQFSS